MSIGVNISLDDTSNGSLYSSKFDYGSLQPAVAKFLRGQAERIRRHCSTSIIQIGKALQESKRHLSHGAFVCWVESEVGVPARTAQAYMRVAGWASGKSATVAHLAPSALYILSATGVPDDFVADILSRTEAGERITPSAMREYLKAFRSSERQEPVGAKLSARRASQNDRVSEAEAGDGRVRDAAAEFVAILMRGLSAADLSRVRDIVTDGAVLAEPQLGRRLARAFDLATEECVALI